MTPDTIIIGCFLGVLLLIWIDHMMSRLGRWVVHRLERSRDRKRRQHVSIDAVLRQHDRNTLFLLKERFCGDEGYHEIVEWLEDRCR